MQSYPSKTRQEEQVSLVQFPVHQKRMRQAALAHKAQYRSTGLQIVVTVVVALQAAQAPVATVALVS
jgi:hypothetical protein